MRKLFQLREFGVLALIVATLTVVWGFLVVQPMQQTTPGLTLSGEVAVLEPADWIGKPCPLGSHISPALDLETGAWTVFLCRRNCPNSLRLLQSEEFRRTVSSPQTRIAVVEIPSTSNSAFPPFPGSVAKSALSSQLKWYCETPAVLSLRDGKVTSVNAGETARTASPIALTQKIVNVGSVPLYGRKHVSITVFNQSDTAIRLSAKAPCSCIVTSIPQPDLAPKSETTVDLLYSPRSPDRVGSRIEPIHIVPTLEGRHLSPETFYIAAEVKPEVYVTPPRIDFGDLTESTLSNAIERFTVGSDDSDWRGIASVDSPPNVVAMVAEKPADRFEETVTVQVLDVPLRTNRASNPLIVAEVIHVNTVVKGQSLRVMVPVTGRIWRGACFVRPAVCYSSLESADQDRQLRFSVADKRRAPNWSAAQVECDSLRVTGITQSPVSANEQLWEVSVRPIRPQQRRHELVLKLYDRDGEESRVPVSVVSYLDSSKENDDG